MFKYFAIPNFTIFLVLAITLATVVGLGYFLLLPNVPKFAFAASFLVFLTALIVRVALTGEVKTERQFSFLTIPLLMLGFWATMQAMFDDFNIQAIIYHAIYGFASFGIPDLYLELSGLIFSGIVIIGLAMSVGVAQSKFFSRFDIIALVPLVLFNPLSVETVKGLGFGASGKQILPSHYKPLTTLKLNKPEKPNVLHIYLESAERTLANEHFFGPVMRPIMELEGRGMSAINIHQTKNTEWTIAGMVASNCGVPLIQPWLVSSRNLSSTGDRFLPNTICLGEILKKNGYHAEHITGADRNFAGKARFYFDHGFSKVTGFDEIYDGYSSHKVHNFLGDSAVFDYSEKVFRQLSGNNQPFLMTLSSTGGHGPAGFALPSCLDGSVEIKSKKPIAVGLECANVMAKNMLDRLEADGLLENTVVIIQSDHLLMGSELASRLNQMERRNLFIAFGPGIEPKRIERPASMMDVFPTILDILGYDITDDAAGLGISLLSQKQNLIEKLGVEKLNDAILYDADLRRMLWLKEEEAKVLF